jgi:site-specific DNA recombinase
MNQIINDKNSIENKKAIIYLRVSTEEQVDNFSLDTQEGICRKEAEKRGYEVIEMFKEEGRSAKTIFGRPTLISLLEYARKNKNKFQALFVYRLDRISRQTADYLAIRKKLGECGVSIISATEPTGDSPTEKLVETILAGFAQLDNDIRSERAKNGLRARYRSGLISGKPPIGYKFELGFAVKDQETWDKVKFAWDIMASGKTSLRQIAKIMTDRGLREIHGKQSFKIRAQTANYIFRQKFYAGILTSKTYPDEVKGQHLPMITLDQFYKVQAVLDGRKIGNMVLVRRTRENEDFPLRRIVRCSICNVGLTGGWSRGRKKKYPYYRCAGDCSKSIKVDVLENTLISLLKKISPKKETIDLFVARMYKIYHQRYSRLKLMKEKADIEIGNLQEMRRQLVEKNLAGIYSDEIFKEQNAIIEDKMIRAQIVKEDSIIDKYNIDKVTDFMRIILADLGATYKKSSLSQIKVLLGSIFPSGLAWNYNGTLNHTINPIYQAISSFSSKGVRSGVVCRT